MPRAKTERAERRVPPDIACRICGGAEHRLAARRPSAQYVQCAACGVTRQRPYPSADEVSAYYRAYLARKNAENPLYLSKAYWETFKREKDLTFGDLRLGPDVIRDAAVLDIGCATGQFLEYVRLHGGRGVGIDPSAELVRLARAKGLRCSTRRLEAVRQRFDVASMWHVIEHVPDPRVAVEHVHRLLKPEGGFLVETPCTGVIADAFGDDWRFYMPVEHLHLFSQEGLFRLLTQSGFEIVSWARFGSGVDSGTVPALNKRVSDTIAKRLGIGDTIAVWSIRT